MRSQSTALTIPDSKEIPIDHEPHGSLERTYDATSDVFRKALRDLLIATVFMAVFWLMYFFTGLRPTDTDYDLSLFALYLTPILMVYATCNVAFQLHRWVKRDQEHYSIYVDGLIVQLGEMKFSYVWWFDLRDYRVETRFSYPIAIILCMEDGREYRLDSLFGRPREIIKTLSDTLYLPLIQRTIERVRTRGTETFGKLKLTREGFLIEKRGLKQFIKWHTVISCDIDYASEEILIWIRRPVSVISANNPVGYYPALSATITSRQFPNLHAFLKIIQTVGQFNRLRFDTNDPSLPYYSSVKTMFQSEPRGLYVDGRSRRWKPVWRWLRYTIVLTPMGIVGLFVLFVLDFFLKRGTFAYDAISLVAGLGFLMGGWIGGGFCLGMSIIRAAEAAWISVRRSQRITEVFAKGMIIHNKKRADVVLWSEIRQYRLRYMTSLLTSYKVSVEIETTDHRRWRFSGEETNRQKFKDLLTGLPHTSLETRALGELTAESKTVFGPLAITQEGLMYRNRLLPWREMSGLMEWQGKVLIRRVGQRWTFASVRIDRVPNYYVFLSLISRMRSLQ